MKRMQGLLPAYFFGPGLQPDSLRPEQNLENALAGKYGALNISYLVLILSHR